MVGECCIREPAPGRPSSSSTRWGPSHYCQGNAWRAAASHIARPPHLSVRGEIMHREASARCSRSTGRRQLVVAGTGTALGAQQRRDAAKGPRCRDTRAGSAPIEDERLAELRAPSRRDESPPCAAGRGADVIAAPLTARSPVGGGRRAVRARADGCGRGDGREKTEERAVYLWRAS